MSLFGRNEKRYIELLLQDLEAERKFNIQLCRLLEEALKRQPEKAS